MDNIAHYKGIFDAHDAHARPLAGDWEAKLTPFARLCVLRCLRPDKVVDGMREFVGGLLGERFTEPLPLNLGECFQESGPGVPLIFVLSPGG